MVQSAISVADRHPAVPAVLAMVPGVCNDLLERFSLVRDGRSGQGRDHPVAAVLALAAAAVVAGMKGYTAIAGWVKDVPPPVLADLYLRAGAVPARPPSKTTIWRITDADAEVFDATVGRWLMDRQAAGQEDGAGGADPAGLVPVGWMARRSGAPGTPEVTSGICWRRWPALTRPARSLPRRPRSGQDERGAEPCYGIEPGRPSACHGGGQEA